MTDLKSFDKLPKTIKKTIRYIKQDINTYEKLEYIEEQITLYINERKEELSKKNK